MIVSGLPTYYNIIASGLETYSGKHQIVAIKNFDFLFFAFLF